MKTRHPILRRVQQWAVVLVAAFGIVSALHAQQVAPVNTPSKKETVMNLPNTPQEVWNRILILMKKNQGFVSKQEVEEVMGMRFTHTEVDDEKLSPRLGSQFFHLFKQEVPGLGELSIGLFEDPKVSRLRMHWGPENADRPNCPHLDKVVQDLRLLDWEPNHPTPVPDTTGIHFWRNSDLVESAKPGGKSLNAPTGISILSAWVPYQSSQCVIGFGATIYR